MKDCAQSEEVEFPASNVLDEPEPFVDERRVAAFLNVSVSTLQRWRMEGGGPEFYKLGAKKVAYRLTGCARWAEGRVFNSISEADTS